MKIKFKFVLSLVILLAACRGSEDRKSYQIKVNQVEVQRLPDLMLDSQNIYSCLSTYNLNNSVKTVQDYKDYGNKTAGINMGFTITTDDAYSLGLRIRFYRDSYDADRWFKHLFETKPKRLKYLPGVGDVAFIPAGPEYWNATSVILYGNAILSIDIESRSKRIPHYTADRNNTKKIYESQNPIYRDFIQDFYPHFKQCADQAKIPVQESSK